MATPEEFRAAAEVYRELGPEYSDAVAESFVEKINREIAARVDAQLARAPRGPRPSSRPKPYERRAPVTGLAVGAVITGIPLAAVLILMHGSAAARADWHQWLLGALLISAVLSVAAIVARKATIHERLAK